MPADSTRQATRTPARRRIQDWCGCLTARCPSGSVSRAGRGTRGRVGHANCQQPCRLGKHVGRSVSEKPTMPRGSQLDAYQLASRAWRFAQPMRACETACREANTSDVLALRTGSNVRRGGARRPSQPEPTCTGRPSRSLAVFPAGRLALARATAVEPVQASARAGQYSRSRGRQNK